MSANNQEKPKIIYILSSSFSGSTILSLIIGSENSVFNGGEINKFGAPSGAKGLAFSDKPGAAGCICGNSIQECPFWGKVYESFDKRIEFNPAPGISWKNLFLLLRTIIPFLRTRVKEDYVDDYGTLMNHISKVALQRYPHIESIIDSSKSIQTLNAIYSSGDYPVEVIHLIRKPVNTINSFKKHGYSFLYGFFSWFIVNWVGRKYLEKTGIKNITISYEALCLETEDTFRKINNFFGINLNVDQYISRMNVTRYHVFSGNPLLRKGRNFTGLNYQDRVLELTRFEKAIASWLNLLYVDINE